MASSGVVIALVVFVFFLILATSGGLWYFNFMCDYGLGGGSCPSPGAPSGGGATPGSSGGGTPGTSGGTPGGTPGTSGGSGASPSDSGAVLGYTPGSAPAPASTPAPASVPGSPSTKINCSGHWGSCNGTCGTDKVKPYVIDTPAANGGDPCKDTDGTVLTSSSTKSCGDLGPCGRDCVGAWVTSASTDADGWSTCPSCGPGTQTRTWHNDPTQTQIPPGNACAHAEGTTETRACPSAPACVVPVDCQGSWSAWEGCSVGCGTGGTQTQTYTITRNSSNGGQACMDGTTNLETDVSARTKSRACQPAPPMCCTDVSDQVGPWVDGAGDCGSNNQFGQPYLTQSRVLKTGATATQADVARCGIEVYRQLKTARACPNQPATSGTCSYGSYDKNASTHCPTVSPNTTGANGGTCAGGWTENQMYCYGQAGCSGGPQKDYSNGRYDTGQQSCVYDTKKTNANCSATRGGMSCSFSYDYGTEARSDKITSITCPTNYTNVNGTCTAVQNSITNLTCPTGYTIPSSGVGGGVCSPTTACVIATGYEGGGNSC